MTRTLAALPIALAACAGAAPALREIAPSRGLQWPGNAIPALNRDTLLMAYMRQGTSGRYEVAVLRSPDNGASWTPAAVITDDPAHDFYDPMLVRASDATLLAGIHSNGTIYIYQSSDDGRTWMRRGAIAPDSGRYNSEVFLRYVDGRLVALYASYSFASETSRFELRSSHDHGHTWSRPTIAAEGGRIRDATRAWLSPPDRRGRLLLVYSWRPQPSGPASVRSVMVSTSLAVLTEPADLAVDSVPPWLGLFPIALVCDDGWLVGYSAWNPATGMGRQRWITGRGSARPGRYRALATISDSAGYGYGRVWLSHDWSGNTLATLVEVPEPSRSRMLLHAVAAEAGCHW